MAQIYNNGISFILKDGFKVLDLVEDAVNREVLERDYKGACCHPAEHYRLHIIFSYEGKKYRFTLKNSERNYTEVDIEMFTEVGFKDIANISTLGLVGKANEDLNRLYLCKTTDEQRQVAGRAVKRAMQYIAVLA